MATYIVGDIQGCYDPLRRILDRVGFDPPNDKLWAVGDLVNRGPASLDVVRFVRSLGSSFWSVLGNHDLHLLAVAFETRKPRKKDTLEQLLRASDRDEIVDWLRRLPLAFYGENTLLVHAGVPPDWSLEQTLQRSGEVEGWLRGEQIREYLSNMYGDQPDAFREQQDAITRARTITNVLTRLRFCSPDGRLDFDSKGGLESCPRGMRPWYAHEQRVLAGTPVAFGHWAMLYGRVETNNVFALDSACVWGHELTLMRSSDRKRFSCSCG